ncbi:MAG: DUF3782 domain-containing protein [Bacteroidia bacterium]|nr:DUF3782 domain-containing protein [Bacteroidia bacterium]
MDEIRDILKELATDLVLMKETQKDTALKSQQEWKEIAERFRETDEKFKETAESFKETDKKFKETDRFVKEVSKKLGELGNKMGSFTEGLALPSLSRILQRDFGATHIFPRARAVRPGQSLEIDVLGYANGSQNTAVAVEVKSHLKEEHVDQLLRILADFPQFYPEHATKKLYGILAGVNVPDTVRNLALKKGLYVGQISEETFRLRVPDNFRPQNFQPLAA